MAQLGLNINEILIFLANMPNSNTNYIWLKINSSNSLLPKKKQFIRKEKPLFQKRAGIKLRLKYVKDRMAVEQI